MKTRRAERRSRFSYAWRRAREKKKKRGGGKKGERSFFLMRTAAKGKEKKNDQRRGKKRDRSEEIVLEALCGDSGCGGRKEKGGRKGRKFAPRPSPARCVMARVTKLGKEGKGKEGPAVRSSPKKKAQRKKRTEGRARPRSCVVYPTLRKVGKKRKQRFSRSFCLTPSDTGGRGEEERGSFLDLSLFISKKRRKKGRRENIIYLYGSGNKGKRKKSMTTRTYFSSLGGEGGALLSLTFFSLEERIKKGGEDRQTIFVFRKEPAGGRSRLVAVLLIGGRGKKGKEG